MYNRIVVAIDGTDASARALKESVRLVRNSDTALRLVYVVDTCTLFGGGAESRGIEVERIWRRSGRGALEQARALLREGGVEPETMVVSTEGEDVCEAIVNVATRWDADLIVTGTRGRCGLRRLLLGSVAEGIVRRSPIPVLICRAQGRP